MTTEPTLAERRLRHLYEISTYLTRFEGVGRTLAAVVAVAARALPVRTAVLILEAGGQITTHLWKTDDVDAPRAAEAIDRARAAHGWFRGAPPSRDREPAAPSVRGLPAPTDDVVATSVPFDPRYLAMPLVVQRGQVFGVFQVEGAAVLDEGDLFFINAATNQIAVAIDRQRAIDDAEARARTQLDFTRALTDSVGEGILATDTDARITFMNPAAEELLGWGEAEVLGRHSHEVLHVQAAEGTRLGEADCPLGRALAAGTRIVCDDHAFFGRDGAAIPVSYTAAPMRSAGRISGAALVFREVLALKRSERSQRLLANSSAALADSLDYGEILLALVRCTIPSFADLCLVDELIAGLPRKGAEARAPAHAGPRLIDDVSSETIASLTEDPAHAAALRDNGVTSLLVVPVVVRERSFGRITLAMAGSGRRFTRDDVAVAEELARRTATALDNARLHRATHEAIRDRQDVLAMVSHDLRTPLNTVSLAARGLLRRYPQPEHDRRRGDRRAVEMIDRATTRMTRMTNDLLDGASIEAGHLAIDAEPTSVVDLLADIVEEMAGSADAAGRRLVVQPADPALCARCDRDRIRQVLGNLVGNAVKFAPVGGSIDVSAQADEGFVRFAVADTGAGIPADVIPHLFQRYRQAEKTASMGRGLGLFIARGIVEAHGGNIGVAVTPGQGTTFTFRLPRVGVILHDAPADERLRTPPDVADP